MKEGTAKGSVTIAFHIFFRGKLLRSMSQAVVTPMKILNSVTAPARRKVLSNSSRMRGRKIKLAECAQPASCARNNTYIIGKALSTINKTTESTKPRGILGLVRYVVLFLLLVNTFYSKPTSCSNSIAALPSLYSPKSSVPLGGVSSENGFNPSESTFGFMGY